MVREQTRAGPLIKHAAVKLFLRGSLARAPWPARGLTTKNTQISKGKTHLWHGTRACRVAPRPFCVKIVYEGERKWYTTQSKAHSAKRT